MLKPHGLRELIVEQAGAYHSRRKLMSSSTNGEPVSTPLLLRLNRLMGRATRRMFQRKKPTELL